MKDKSAWMKTDLAIECISLFGNHDVKIIKYGSIGYVEYCRLCGEGQWVNLKNEVRAEEGIHFVVVPKER